MAVLRENIRKMRGIAELFRNTAEFVVEQTVWQVTARVTGNAGNKPDNGATPIGRHRMFQHGLLLGNWRLSTTANTVFNPKSYITNREMIHHRLLSYAGPRKFMLGKKYYLTNATPYAEEIDEASGNRRYQAKHGILPEIARSMVNGRAMQGYKTLLMDTGIKLTVDVEFVSVFGSPSVFYTGKRKALTEMDEYKQEIKRVDAMRKNFMMHPLHPETTASEGDIQRVYARERRNATRRYAKALTEQKEKLGLVKHRNKTKKDDGQGNK